VRQRFAAVGGMELPIEEREAIRPTPDLRK
jgi:hypothetical protein